MNHSHQLGVTFKHPKLRFSSKFSDKAYKLPDFVDKMDKRKVFVISNYGFFPAKIINFQLLNST